MFRPTLVSSPYNAYLSGQSSGDALCCPIHIGCASARSQSHSESIPIFHIDISPWGEEVATNLQMLQDRMKTETCAVPSAVSLFCSDGGSRLQASRLIPHDRAVGAPLVVHDPSPA